MSALLHGLQSTSTYALILYFLSIFRKIYVVASFKVKTKHPHVFRLAHESKLSNYKAQKNVDRYSHCSKHIMVIEHETSLGTAFKQISRFSAIATTVGRHQSVASSTIMTCRVCNQDEASQSRPTYKDSRAENGTVYSTNGDMTKP